MYIIITTTTTTTTTTIIIIIIVVVVVVVVVVVNLRRDCVELPASAGNKCSQTIVCQKHNY